MWAQVSFLTGLGLLWGWSLIKLYKDIKDSRKLLPRVGVFKLHGYLLGTWLILYIVSILLLQIGSHLNLTTNQKDIVFGICWILFPFFDFTELTTFFLVVSLMLPVTEKAKQRYVEMQSFIFGGFVDREELESAVLEQNPDLTTSQKEFL